MTKIEEFIFPTIPADDKINIASFLERRFGKYKTHVYWKNNHGLYQWCNLVQAQSAHLEKPADVVNLSVYDLFEEQTADVLDKADNKVIDSDERLLLTEEGTTLDGQFLRSISVKQPLKDEHGEIYGLIGLSTIINNVSYLKEQFQIRAKKSGLSLKQTECLYWLMRGLTAKQTADILHMSKRTIESYLTIVKDKLFCTSKQDLIKIAFSYYAP
ncbi:hypothetical protein TUM19329_20090 [Legionella antarctica]|uniref:HTH luxR-type domain-containing protein n=2 Tax=Legionella antarctica TaxID=2708020 RepID=A0A6F8T5G5_9GAMM|nr:hypothetical protein TUM19329_20090 [Legionella antarctica]